MQRLVRIMDDIDDVLGIMTAASSGAYVLIVALSGVLLISATSLLGLRGLIGAMLVCGVAIAAAGYSARD